VGGVATLVASVPLFFLATRQQLARHHADLIPAVAVDEQSNLVQLPMVNPELGVRRTV